MTIAQVRGHNIKAVEAKEVGPVRCQVAATACIQGHQFVRVEARAPSCGATVDGVVSLRIGNVIIYCEDFPALESLSLAVNRAVEIADRAFSPPLPPPLRRKYKAA